MFVCNFFKIEFCFSPELCSDVGPQDNVFGASPRKGFDFLNTSPHQLGPFGLSETEPSPAPFKFPSTSPPESPTKSVSSKSFWDDPQPANIPPNTFFFGPQTSGPPNAPPVPAPRGIYELIYLSHFDKIISIAPYNDSNW